MLARFVIVLLMLRIPVPDRAIQHVIAKALTGGGSPWLARQIGADRLPGHRPVSPRREDTLWVHDDEHCAEVDL
jgi:hypothetical protein